MNQEQLWLQVDIAVSLCEDWDDEPDLDLLMEPTPRQGMPFPSWHRQAACIGGSEQTFFGARNTTERPAVSMTDVANAKAICEQCPVYEVCLRTALGLEGENREEYGIWAGTSGRTRKRIWALTDNDGHDLEDIVDDILTGNLAKYERTVSLVPVDAKIVAFSPVVAA